MNIKQALLGAGIVPDPLKDQFFLTDEETIKKIVEFADLKNEDVVLEIGAGTGNITRELAKKAGKVIAFEIDERFKPLLADLPANVEMRFEDAHKFLGKHEGKFKKKKVYNKIVSNPPYSFCEPLLHKLTFIEYDKVILVVPKKLASKIEKNPVFGSFFKVEEKMVVGKEKFYPEPDTDSIVIDLVKLPDSIENRNLPLFLRQYLYQHESQKAKNSLMEGLIRYALLANEQVLTKNQARAIIKDCEISEALLEVQPDNPDIYKEVSEKIRATLLANKLEN